jgi:hypothetical protein
MPDSPRRVDLRLTIPPDAPFQTLAVDLAGRFAEYAGANAGLASEFRAAVQRIITHVGGDEPIVVAMQTADAMVRVDVESGSRHDQTTCPLPK